MVALSRQGVIKRNCWAFAITIMLNRNRRYGYRDVVPTLMSICIELWVTAWKHVIIFLWIRLLVLMSYLSELRTSPNSCSSSGGALLRTSPGIEWQLNSTRWNFRDLEHWEAPAWRPSDWIVTKAFTPWLNSRFIKTRGGFLFDPVSMLEGHCDTWFVCLSKEGVTLLYFVMETTG